MSFLDQCIQDSLPIWQQCLESDFLQGLADGTLDEECFKGYIVDDSLYLREYAKVFAWGMLRAGTMEEIRNYYSLLAFVNEAEDSTRRYYIKRCGLDDAAIQRLPLRPENRAYVDHMLSAAREGGGAAECMMAAMPCMLSYGWIFERLLRDHPDVLKTPYGAFVGDYASGRYDAVCGSWKAFTEKVCEGLSPERQRRCLAIFRQSSLHELNFWRMSRRPREDLN